MVGKFSGNIHLVPHSPPKVSHVLMMNRQHFVLISLLPPANEVHRGVSASVHAGIPPEADTPRKQTPPWSRQSPRSRHPPETDTPRSRHPLEQTPPKQSMLGDTVNARVVGILLECNLVVIRNFVVSQNAYDHMSECMITLNGIGITFVRVKRCKIDKQQISKWNTSFVQTFHYLRTLLFRRLPHNTNFHLNKHLKTFNLSVNTLHGCPSPYSGHCLFMKHPSC